MNKLISVVIPCHNEEKNIIPLVDEIKSVINKNFSANFDLEFVFINDGSKDKTLEILKSLAKNNKNIKIISFYRNFGHQSAVIAGLMFATGDIIVNMDGDFQHPPSTLVEMIKKYLDGHDLVICKKESVDPSGPIYRLIRQVSYPIFGLIGENKIIPGTGDFRLMDKKVLNTIKMLKEARFITRGLVTMYAKNIAIIPYKVADRREGKSSFNFVQHWRLYTSTITSFTIMPLRIATGIGLTLMLIAFGYLIYVLFMKFVLGIHVIEGFTSLIFVVITLFGFLFFYLGILSEYIGALFDEVKDRPKYIIDEKFNIDDL